MSGSNIYRRGYGPPDFAAAHRAMLGHCKAVLDGSEPPNVLQSRRPETSEEILGFPRGTDPSFVQHYLDLRGQFGEIGEELIERRRTRDWTEYKKRRRLQLTRHNAARRKGQPSPLKVVRFVIAYETDRGERRGAAAAAAKYFRKSPSLISKLLKVAEKSRKLLETAQLYFQFRIEAGGGDQDELQALPSILAETDRLLQQLSPRR